MPAIKRTGQFVGPAELVDAIFTAPCRLGHHARKLRSWDNSHSPKTAKAVRALMMQRYAGTESVFDAAHGRRYLCFLYRNKAERRACFDFITGEK